MNAELSRASKSSLPELAKQILRDMGMNPDDVHRDLKKQVKQQNVKTRESLTIHLYHCNHLGTPVALINEQGSIDWAIELDAWGNTVNEYHANPNHPIEQPIRMQGQQLDPESGLFYNRHRFYDPQLGRYLNQDPIGLAGGFNVTAYPTDPVNQVDPLGLEQGTLTDRGYPSPPVNASVFTDTRGQSTLFWDPYKKEAYQFDTRNTVAPSSKPGAGGAYSGKFTYCERIPASNEKKSREYGTTKWRTTDERSRWVHGGGTGLKDPRAARQGWKPTLGCTRAQNEDVEKLCAMSEQYLKDHPGAKINYARY
jgi:RHS repeat-associated protein